MRVLSEACASERIFYVVRVADLYSTIPIISGFLISTTNSKIKGDCKNELERWLREKKV